jgi:hypothetical protein
MSINAGCERLHRTLGQEPGTSSDNECWLDSRPIRDEYLIISGGGLAGTGAHSYKL